MHREVLVFSGGLDSTTLLWDLLRAGRDVAALSVMYGQRHAREVVAAQKVVQEAKDVFGRHRVSHTVISLRDLCAVMTGSSQTDLSVPVPHGHYEDETMRSTVVPNRNMVFLSVAIAQAISLGSTRVLYGAHAGDHAIYPDCRSAFVEAMQQVAQVCHYTPIDLAAPYLRMTKADIVTVGLDLGAPYHMTWTCYEGGTLACGRCGSCQERLAAFATVGVPDPIVYRR